MTYVCLMLPLLLGEAPVAWPGFLGAGASTVEAKSLPLTWSPTENIAWQAELPGYGQSSPIVWQDMVFVTSVEGPMKETCHLLALDRTTGKQLWKHSLAASTQVKSSQYVSRAAPTPATDGKAVYAFFESGDVVACDFEGRPLWERSLVGDYGEFDGNHGVAASTVLTDQAVVLLVDHSGPSYILALDKQNGTNLWKTDRTSRTSWSSPALVPTDQGDQIVCSSSGSVDGYDPKTGKQLWTLADLGGNTTNTPLPFAPGKVLIGASLGRGGEGGGAARRSNLALEIKQVDGKFNPNVLWRAEAATSSFGSPTVHQGIAYWVNRSGVVYAYEVDSGKPCYTHRTEESCWATPIGVGNRVYLLGKNGHTTVLQAGAKAKVLAENDLWTTEQAGEGGQFSGPVQYAGVAVEGMLLIRTGDRLFCLAKGAGSKN